jgi:hypothetical protein
METHGPLPRLLDGVLKAQVGSPLMPLPLAAVAAVGQPGLGREQTLMNLGPNTDLHGRGTHLGLAPEVVTATVYGVGGGSGGPIVGIARWGSGNGVQQQIEFDVPFAGSTLDSLAFCGGAILAVPCTSLTILARNDGNFIPNAGGSPIGSSFGPVGPVFASTSIGMGPKQGNAQLTRTIWAINGGAGLAPTGVVSVPVPPWAQRFRVLRYDASETIQVAMQTAGLDQCGGPFNEAANAQPAVYPVPSTCTAVNVKNTGAGAITNLLLVFELGL